MNVGKTLICFRPSMYLLYTNSLFKRYLFTLQKLNFGHEWKLRKKVGKKFKLTYQISKWRKFKIFCVKFQKSLWINKNITKVKCVVNVVIILITHRLLKLVRT